MCEKGKDMGGKWMKESLIKNWGTLIPKGRVLPSWRIDRKSWVTLAGNQTIASPSFMSVGQCHTSSTSMAQATVNNQWIIQWIIWTSEGVRAFRPRLCCLIPALLLIFLCGLDHIPQHFCLISFRNRSRWYLPEGLIGNLLLTESSLRSCSVILCTESDQTTLLPTKYLEI